jgi:hypothetical protein
VSRHTDARIDKAKAWKTPVARGHLCLPPVSYPAELGPGSRWQCPKTTCGNLWQAEGMQVADEYAADRTLILQPERWVLVTGAAQEGEEALYDWRPLGPYFVKLARAIIDNQRAAMKSPHFLPQDWRMFSDPE